MAQHLRFEFAGALHLTPDRVRPGQKAHMAPARVGRIIEAVQLNVRHIANHLLVDRGRAMAATEVHDHQPRLQLLEHLRRQRDGLPRGMRVLIDLDEVHAAVRGGQLVLHAALLAEPVGLDRMRGGRDLGWSRRRASQVP